MKKRKKHKWKYQINVKKKIIVLTILGVSLFVGLGYALIESNLGFFGRLEYSKYEPTNTLYSALKREVNKGYALKYTGDHQDSMDASKSTEDIYHFYADNDTKGEDIRNKFNVVFADSCWQMLRTTDTGGVRLLYNGEPVVTEVDGNVHYNCGDERGPHISEVDTSISLYGTFMYAKNYTATVNSSNQGSYTLVDDPDDPDDTYTVKIDNNNAQEQIEYIAANYPYTCRNTTGTCTDTLTTAKFYKVISYDTGSRANAYMGTSSDSIGKSVYNSTQSPASIGYKKGDYYKVVENSAGSSFHFGTSYYKDATGIELYDNSFYVRTTAYVADEVDWDNINPGQYTLINPTHPAGASDFSGKYLMLNNTTVGDVVYYVINITGRVDTGQGATAYVKTQTNGEISEGTTIVFGDDVTYNGDGTFSLTNPTAPRKITRSLFIFSTDDVRGKWTCNNASTTCTNPTYITDIKMVTYYGNSDVYAIAKSRNGYNLVDYVIAPMTKITDGYDTTYKDYKYTCGNTDIACTQDNIQYIYQLDGNAIWTYYNYYFGKSYIYENGKYKLQDIENLDVMGNETSFSKHHYFCTEIASDECEKVNYLYYNGAAVGYVEIEDENTTNIKYALDAMLKKNTEYTEIEWTVDKWYDVKFKNTNYESKIDDTIYCNDRSFDTTSENTYEESAWNDNGGIIRYDRKDLKFKENTLSTDLSCKNITDRFSVSNERAQLSNKIALITMPELNLLGNNKSRKTVDVYWTMTPYYYSAPASGVMRVLSIKGAIYEKGQMQIRTSNNLNVRPAISLVAGTRYSQGDGSMTDPYVVDMSE